MALKIGKALLSKSIYDTKKLSKDKLASLGRKGDTEIRNIDGAPAHVTLKEAYEIDLKGRAGEMDTKLKGAGTVNPLTGLKEYQQPASFMQKLSAGLQTRMGGAGGQMTWDQLQQVGIPGAMEQFGLGAEYEKYITPFETKPFEFLQQDLQFGQKTLGSEFGKSYMGATEAQSQAISQANLARSGTIGQKFETGIKDIRSTYDLGTEELQAGYGKGVYTEQQRQMERLYGDIGGVVQMKQAAEAGGGGKK